MTRELTKIYEEAVRGTAGEVLARLAERETIKGEITLVVGPPGEAEAPAAEVIDAALLESAAALPAGKAAAEVAQRFGLAKKELYERLLVLKNKKTS